MGFLWADLGSWCLDKASDFPARNVHSPRETANHRKGEKERKRVRQTERGREREKGGVKGNRGKRKKEKNKCVCVLGGAAVKEKSNVWR